MLPCPCHARRRGGGKLGHQLLRWPSTFSEVQLRGRTSSHINRVLRIFQQGTGLNGHKRGSSCRTYTHSLGVVTPNVIIIYCRYGIGAPIGWGSQAHTFRRYVGYVGFECFLPQARLCPYLMWCVSGSDSVIHRDRPNRPAQ